MAKLISFLTLSLLFSLNSLASTCVKESYQSYLGTPADDPLVVIKKGRHELVYSEDSCGIRGCDIYVFSRMAFCKTQTLSAKGFLLPEKFRGNQLEIRSKGKIRAFKFRSTVNRFVPVGEN